jgi:hypothetical protein
MFGRISLAGTCPSDGAGRGPVVGDSGAAWGRSLTGSAEGPVTLAEKSVRVASGLAPSQTTGWDPRSDPSAHVPSPRTGSGDSTIQTPRFAYGLESRTKRPQELYTRPTAAVSLRGPLWRGRRMLGPLWSFPSLSDASLRDASTVALAELTNSDCYHTAACRTYSRTGPKN